MRPRFSRVDKKSPTIRCLNRGTDSRDNKQDYAREYLCGEYAFKRDPRV